MKNIRSICLVLIYFTILCGMEMALAMGSSDTPEMKFQLKITDGLKAPLRITIDDRDFVYVTDAVGGRICRYDSSGQYLGEFRAGSSPLAITVTHQHLLYVGDKVSGELQLFDTGGTLMKKISNDFGGFELPSSAVMDHENRLYVVDGKKRSVSIFDADGIFVSSFGDSVLKFPTGIAFDPKNQRLLVAEHGGMFFPDNSDSTRLIHAFDLQGNWLKSFGKYGQDKGQFTRIQGLTVDRFGRIYAADIFQGTVTVLNEKGEYLATVGQFGTEPGELRAPIDVAIDSRGRLWVASMNSGNLVVYNLEDIPTAVASDPEPDPIIPSRSALLQNYPNPFNPGTWIPFVLEKDAYVTIYIYNEVGQVIRTFDLGKQKSGSYTNEGNSVYWDGTNNRGESVASGVYIYEIRSGDFVAVRRMLLLK